MTKVKVNHSGNCTHPETGVTHHYTVGVIVALPDEILEALGEDNYEVVEKSQPKQEEKKEEKKEDKK